MAADGAGARDWLEIGGRLGGSAWLVSTYDIYYVLKALSKYLLHLG